MIWSGVGTKLLATIVAAYGFGLITPIRWMEIALVWGYSISWAFLTDLAKVYVYRYFSMETRRHDTFLKTVQQIVTPHGHRSVRTRPAPYGGSSRTTP